MSWRARLTFERTVNANVEKIVLFDRRDDESCTMLMICILGHVGESSHYSNYIDNCLFSSLLHSVSKFLP